MYLSQHHGANRNTDPIPGKKIICQKEFCKHSVSCKAERCWKDRTRFEQVKVGKTYVALTSACWDLSVSSFNVLLSWLKWFTWEVSSENVLINPEFAWLPSAIHHLLAVRRRNISEVKEDTARKAGSQTCIRYSELLRMKLYVETSCPSFPNAGVKIRW